MKKVRQFIDTSGKLSQEGFRQLYFGVCRDRNAVYDHI